MDGNHETLNATLHADGTCRLEQTAYKYFSNRFAIYKNSEKNRNVRDIWGNLVGILKQTGRQLCKSDLHYISNISASKQLTPYHVDVAPTFWGQKVQVCAVKYDLDCALAPIIWIKYALPPAPHTP